MKLNKFAILVLVLADVGCLQAQAPGSNAAAFRASLQRFQSQTVKWQNDLARIKVEELPISYAEGKAIDQNKDVAALNLDLLSKLSARVLNSGHLSDEINLVATIQQLGSQLQAVATLLLDTNVKDDVSAKKIMGWSKPLTDLATGAVNNLYVDTFSYVIAHASEVEARQCSFTK